MLGLVARWGHNVLLVALGLVTVTYLAMGLVTVTNLVMAR